METNNYSPEEQELIDILNKVNVLNVYAIRFYPLEGIPFNVMTENIKKISLILIGKDKQNMSFAPNELRDIFERIKAHLPSKLGLERRMVIESAIENFINKGGTIEIITRISRVKREIIVFISFFIIILGTFLVLCGGGIIWMKSKFLFITLIVVYLAFLGFHFLVTRKMENKLKEESIDLTPDTPGYRLLKNIGNATGTLVITELLLGILGLLLSFLNPFK